MRETYNKKYNILLVEDDPGDVRLITEVFKEGAIKHNVFVSPNGLEALNFLRNEGTYKETPTPDLIILDLNMPVMNGFEFLKEAKRDHLLKNIPVCVLSTSSFDKDLDEAYNLHANCYLIKPLQLNAYRHMIRTIETFWLQMVALPRE